jgi:hypothetical protein
MFKKTSVFFKELHKRKAHIRKGTIGVSAIQIRPYQLPLDRQITFFGKPNDHPIRFILVQLLSTVCEYPICGDIP